MPAPPLHVDTSHVHQTKCGHPPESSSSCLLCPPIQHCRNRMEQLHINTRISLLFLSFFAQNHFVLSHHIIWERDNVIIYKHVSIHTHTRTCMHMHTHTYNKHTWKITKKTEYGCSCRLLTILPNTPGICGKRSGASTKQVNDTSHQLGRRAAYILAWATALFCLLWSEIIALSDRSITFLVLVETLQ